VASASLRLLYSLLYSEHIHQPYSNFRFPSLSLFWTFLKNSWSYLDGFISGSLLHSSLCPLFLSIP
jgi:hypothetical protein